MAQDFKFSLAIVLMEVVTQATNALNATKVQECTGTIRAALSKSKKPNSIPFAKHPKEDTWVDSPKAV